MEQCTQGNLAFLQALAGFLDQQGITCTFDRPPAQDPSFWSATAGKAESSAAQTLAAIAACLREDTTDFDCIDRIIALLESQGLSTLPRHDFS